jgi:hypothetical protein
VTAKSIIEAAGWAAAKPLREFYASQVREMLPQLKAGCPKFDLYLRINKYGPTIDIYPKGYERADPQDPWPRDQLAFVDIWQMESITVVSSQTTVTSEDGTPTRELFKEIQLGGRTQWYGPGEVDHVVTDPAELGMKALGIFENTFWEIISRL